MSKSKKKIGAIVLAAGESKRMGRPKLVLPWEESTVIGHIIHVLEQVDLDEILVVTGGSSKLVENALSGYQVRTILNPAYREGEMLSSVKVGLNNLGSEIEAALITLGDQPSIQLKVVKLIIKFYRSSGSSLVVPSYEMRRGHPWLVDKKLWSEILKLDYRFTLRDFLNANQGNINYIGVDTNSILLDIDTPDDYLEYRSVD
jgi:molybdenum cofactor cytidylyltransferase